MPFLPGTIRAPPPRKPTMVVRLGPDGKVVPQGAQVEIGGEDKYISLCRRHWEEETGRQPPEDLIGFRQAKREGHCDSFPTLRVTSVLEHRPARCHQAQ